MKYLSKTELLCHGIMIVPDILSPSPHRCIWRGPTGQSDVNYDSEDEALAHATAHVRKLVDPTLPPFLKALEVGQWVRADTVDGERQMTVLDIAGGLVLNLDSQVTLGEAKGDDDREGDVLLPASKLKEIRLARMRLIIDVVYELNDESAFDMACRLDSLCATAANQGLFTGDTTATVEEFSSDVIQMTEEAYALGEKELTDWLADQIGDGVMKLEEVPGKMARFALTDPYQMQLEMAERIAESEG